MKQVIKENTVSLLAVLTGFVVVALLYGRMPAVIPVHWSVDGTANGWMPRSYGAWVLPVTNVVVMVVLVAAKTISPSNWEITKFGRSYQVLVASINAFLLLITVIATWAAIGGTPNVSLWVASGGGVLLLVLGNYMGKLTKNFFIGIRTPWTLADDEVWLRTNRLGGKLFVAAGLASVAGSWMNIGVMIFALATITAALASVVYSYVIYRRLQTAS
jgi:uncharacterized membrane protein